MINHVLSVDGFYFSTTYDLTHTLQRLSNTSPEFQEMSLLERVSLIFSYYYFFFNFKELFSISSIKYILIFLSPGSIRIMYGALKVYHVSNRHLISKFRTPESVYVTQTGLRTTGVHFQKSSLNMNVGNFLALCVLCCNSYQHQEHNCTCKINVLMDDVLSAVVLFIVFTSRKVTT